MASSLSYYAETCLHLLIKCHICIQGCQQIKRILTASKGGRLEKLIEGTFGRMSGKDDGKSSLNESKMRFEDLSVQRKRKFLDAQEKYDSGKAPHVERTETDSSSKDYDGQLRKKVMKYNAVQVDVRAQYKKQPSSAMQNHDIQTLSGALDDGKFQEITVLECEQLPQTLRSRLVGSQHSRQPSQRSICLSDLSASDSGNAQTNKDLNENEFAVPEVETENACHLASEQMRSRIGASAPIGVHLRTGDPVDGSEMVHEVQPTNVLGNRDSSRYPSSSKSSVAKPSGTEDREASRSFVSARGSVLQEVQCSHAKSDGLDADKGRLFKKKKLKKHKRRHAHVEDSLCPRTRAVLPVPEHTVGTSVIERSPRRDVLKGPVSENVMTNNGTTPGSLSRRREVRIKVKGPHLLEEHTSRVQSAHPFVQETAETSVATFSVRKTTITSPVREQSRGDLEMLEKRYSTPYSSNPEHGNVKSPSNVAVRLSEGEEEEKSETGEIGRGVHDGPESMDIERFSEPWGEVAPGSVRATHSKQQMEKDALGSRKSSALSLEADVEEKEGIERSQFLTTEADKEDPAASVSKHASFDHVSIKQLVTLLESVAKECMPHAVPEPYCPTGGTHGCEQGERGELCHVCELKSLPSMLCEVFKLSDLLFASTFMDHDFCNNMPLSLSVRNKLNKFRNRMWGEVTNYRNFSR